MSKQDKLCLRCLAALTLAAVLLGVSNYLLNGPKPGEYALGWLNDSFGFVLMALLACLAWLGARLIFSGGLRDVLLGGLSRMHERDEREEMLSAKAARFSYLSGLCVLILLFGLSCLQISVYRVPPELAQNGKTGRVSLGLNFELTQKQSPETTPEPAKETSYFKLNGLPLSQSGLLLGLIVWQLAAYRRALPKPCGS